MCKGLYFFYVSYNSNNVLPCDPLLGKCGVQNLCLENMAETVCLINSFPCFSLPSSTIEARVSKNSSPQSSFQLEVACGDSSQWDVTGKLLVPYGHFLPGGSGSATVITVGSRAESQKEPVSLKVSLTTILFLDSLSWDFLWH